MLTDTYTEIKQSHHTYSVNKLSNSVMPFSKTDKTLPIALTVPQSIELYLLRVAIFSLSVKQSRELLVGKEWTMHSGEIEEDRERKNSEKKALHKRR